MVVNDSGYYLVIFKQNVFTKWSSFGMFLDQYFDTVGTTTCNCGISERKKNYVVDSLIRSVNKPTGCFNAVYTKYEGIMFFHKTSF